MAKLFANNGDPDQTLCPVASDPGLHCLLITLLRVSRLQCVNYTLDIRSMWGYIVFAFPFVRPFVRTYVRSYVRSFVRLSVTGSKFSR